MDMIKGIPAWNFEVLVNVFDDDSYWDITLQEDMPEAYEAISSIGKKYSDIGDYEDALEIYNKYEPQIIEYYGGKKAVDFIIDELDTVPVGIIKPPKLKNKLRAKYVEGISYSTGKYYDPVTPEQQEEWDKGRFTDDGNPEGDEIPDLTRSFKRALRATVIKKSMAASTVVFNTDIISQIRSGKIMSDEETDDSVKHLSFDEHMKLYEKRHKPVYEKLTNDEIKALIDGKDTVTHRYALTDSAQISTDIFIKKQMIKSGLNPISKERKKSMSRAELNRLASFLGPEYVYDEKTMRKLIKKTEKLKRDTDRENKRYEKNYKEHTASTARALTSLLTARSRLTRMALEDDDE